MASLFMGGIFNILILRELIAKKGYRNRKNLGVRKISNQERTNNLDPDNKIELIFDKKKVKRKIGY
jgi:hypothetical protein